jgi:hypothetical protein
VRARSVFLAAAITAVVLATIVGTAVVAWHAAKLSVAATNVFTPREETVDVASLVTQVRQLNRLETASMHVIHIGTITQSYHLMPNSVAGDQLTFLAAGDVIAGLDLSQLQQNDVWRESDGTIALRLPSSQILVSRIDNRESRVLSRKTGMFRRPDNGLETRARQHAEAMVRAEALRKGILKMASDNGETKLGGFLHTIGFQKVRFVTAGSPATGEAALSSRP